MEKKVVNVLSDWKSYSEFGDLRISGKATVKQARVDAGQYLVTSPLKKLFWVDGVLHAETQNSLYMLLT